MAEYSGALKYFEIFHTSSILDHNFNTGSLKHFEIFHTSSILDVNYITGSQRHYTINMSSGNIEMPSSGRLTIELSEGNVYFAMRGKDDGGFKTWVASGAPDTTASQFTGQISGSMTDIVVLQTWSS